MRFGGPVTTFLIVRRGKSTRNESPVSVVGAVPMGIIGIMPVSRSRVCIACLRPVGVIHLLHSRSFLNSRKLKLVTIATNKYFGHHAGVRGQRTLIARTALWGTLGKIVWFVAESVTGSNPMNTLTMRWFS